MALMNYTRPNVDVQNKRFSDILDEFFNDTLQTRTNSFNPSVDISETDKEFEVSVALPGMKKEDIQVDLDNGHLTISGERKFENEEEGKNYHRVESGFGTFRRSFYLPDTVDEESIKAKYQDGVLNITIAKNEEKVKKQIEIA